MRKRSGEKERKEGRRLAASWEAGRQGRKKALRLARRNWMLYLFILPAILYVLLFSYAPMYGVQIAFRNYKPRLGFWGSEWVGLKWFQQFLSMPRFWNILKNTVGISVYSLVCGYPLPILLALILNNIRNERWKKFAQTVTYLPHFISTVIICGMLSMFLSPNSGIINTMLKYLGGSGNTYFLGNPNYFSSIYVWSGVWQGVGWGSILYLAALTGVDPELHDSASVDGANRIKRIWYIDIPSILPTMVITLILNFGSIMSVGYEKVYLLQNNLNITASEVISTYVYKQGLLNQQYSYSSAVGLFNSVINVILLITVNKIADRVSGMGLF